MPDKHKPVVLIIRDGWGENHDASYDEYNAVKLADTPVADRLRADYPRTEIEACGLAVGLPEGIMGNSEVGHQNIGAGRVVFPGRKVHVDPADNAAVRPVPLTRYRAAQAAKAG